MPPPEIKTIIDKLVKQIAPKNPSESEQFIALILQKEPHNLKFNFLKHKEDPYRPYYKSKLAEERGE